MVFLFSYLDIATAKATPDEMKTAPHHLIDFLDPQCETFTVQDFKRQSLGIIEDLRKRNKMTVIVGGTNYYIESLLWNFTVDSAMEVEKSDANSDENFKFTSETTAVLYEKLRTLDKATAEKLHPNNRRKILTALRHVESGQRSLSEEILDQHASVASDEFSNSLLRGKLRFPNCIGLMIDCKPDVLETRIRNRVEKMISEGLLRELEDFHSKYYEKRREKGFETGIFQVLGFKEFEKYFSLPIEERQTKTGLKFYNEAVELLKQRSVRYSKAQLKWINKRILRHGDPENRLKVFRLDSSDLEHWSENVHQKAVEIVDSFLNGTECPHLPIEELFEEKTDPHKRFVCDICDGKVVIGEICFHEHLKGKAHKAKSRKRKLAAEKETLNALTEKSDNLWQFYWIHEF